MDICKQRNTKVYQIITKRRLGFAGTLKCYGQGCRAGHGTDRRHVGRTVIFDDVPAVASGIGACNRVQQCQPDIMSQHNDQNNDQEDRKLLCNTAFIGQSAEGAADQNRKNRDQKTCNDAQYDFLEFFQQSGCRRGVIPNGGKADADRKEQCGHNGHDRRNIQLKDDGRKFF